MKGVILSAAKNLLSEGQMLHFVQHDNPSNNLRQNTSSALCRGRQGVRGPNIDAIILILWGRLFLWTGR
jgi:hypothetical protein